MNHTDYYNRKGWYSVILQAVVDHQYLFRDINVGWPGSVHDARVLAHSALFRKAEEGTILNGQSRQIEGCTIPVFLIGNSAYPLLKWLIKPYPENDHMTEQCWNFNYQISRARIVVENVFGRLKASWRRLMKKNDMNVKNVHHVACYTTCVKYMGNLLMTIGSVGIKTNYNSQPFKRPQVHMLPLPDQLQLETLLSEVS